MPNNIQSLQPQWGTETRYLMIDLASSVIQRFRRPSISLSEWGCGVFLPIILARPTWASRIFADHSPRVIHTKPQGPLFPITRSCGSWWGGVSHHFCEPPDSRNELGFPFAFRPVVGMESAVVRSCNQ